MKITTGLTTLVAMAVILPTSPAHAGDKERAFVAGVVTGAVLQNATSNGNQVRHRTVRTRHHTTTRRDPHAVWKSDFRQSHAQRSLYRQPSSRTTYIQAPTGSACATGTYVTSGRNTSYVTTRARAPSGSWQVRNVKVWVPASHVRVRQPCGAWILQEVPGYYTVQRQKVWVEHTPYRGSKQKVVWVR